MNGLLLNVRFTLLAMLCAIVIYGVAPATAQHKGVFEQLTGDSSINLLTNGGFEVAQPAYWTPTGEGATWSNTQARTPGWSLALSGNAAASWAQNEAVRNWVPGIPGGSNPELVVGGWIWTDGVNTNPQNDDEKFQLSFSFFDENGTDVLGGPVVLDLPQDQATTGGWVELSSASLGAIAMPGEQAAKSARIEFVKGANATGTAYLDDVFLRKADPSADGWSGGWFNANMDAGDTWYYWWSGFDSGSSDWPAEQQHFQYVTSEQAHTGDYSLRIESNGENQSETVAISERVAVTEGEPVLFSFWVKHEGHPAPEEIGSGQNNLGLTVQWFRQLESGPAGYGDVGTVDVTLNSQVSGAVVSAEIVPQLVQEASSGWTQYAFVAYPVEGAVGVEVRPRYWHQFQGVTYWDDIVVMSLGGTALTGVSIEDDAVTEVPEAFMLHQNYPNPFNPSTTIAFDLPNRSMVSLAVYNVLGQRVATLLNEAVLVAGQQTVTFDAGALPSGMYLYVLQANGRTEARRMMLVK